MDRARVSSVEELEKKLEDNRKARADLEEEQYVKDLTARIDLEEEHGTIAAVKVARFRPGQPTMALLRTPTSSEYKRYKDLIHRAVDKKNVAGQQEAADQLGKSCWVYPARAEKGADDAQTAMLDAFPGLLTSIAMASAALAEGKTEGVGKG